MNGPNFREAYIGIFNLTSAGSSDIFILKIDSSSNFGWAKKIGGTAGDNSHSIELDSFGNIFCTGSFRGVVDFNPGAGVFNLTSNGSSDIFITKLDVSGNFVWAKSFGSATGSDDGNAISVDAFGNVYSCGDFSGITDFDPNLGVFNLTPLGLENNFISKLDSSGNFLWAKIFGGGGNAITVDAMGNAYITGDFWGTADFDPGTGISILNCNGGADIFILKLDAFGNFLWAQRVGDTVNDAGYSISLDSQGNVYTTGFFQGTCDFDSGTGVYNLTSSGVADIFILKLDALGNFLWAKNIGGTGIDDSKSIKISLTGNIYITGLFQAFVDFDPGNGTYNLTSAGSTDIFLQKMSECCIGINEFEVNQQTVLIYPNPNTGSFKIKTSKIVKNGKFILINSIGQIVFEQKITTETTDIKINELSSGLYNYLLLQDNQIINTGKLIID